MIKKFFIWWGLNIIALWLTAWVVPGISWTSFWALILAALTFGIINILIRPILLVLSLPAMILSLGLFYFIANAFIFWAISVFVPGFVITGFWTAFWGAIIVGIINFILGTIFRK